MEISKTAHNNYVYLEDFRTCEQRRADREDWQMEIDI